MPHEKLIIFGSGPAGLTAALYASRANLSPLIFDGVQQGGQLMITTDVDNFPGFPEGIMGPELMERMRAQVERFGARFVFDTATKVDFSKRPFTIETDNGDTYTADACIIAVGASAKYLGLPNETRLRGYGVSACATCDGFFFRGQEICVIGGGDTAIEEATFLTRFASKVYLIHRRDSLRASKAMQDRAFANPKMEMVWNTEVIDVHGEQKVTGVRLRDTKTGAERDLAVTGMFLGIGHTPNTAPFTPWIAHDESGYLVTTPGKTETSIPGVYVCGDAQDHYYRQAITAAGTGCMAAIECERWFEEHGVG